MRLSIAGVGIASRIGNAADIRNALQSKDLTLFQSDSDKLVSLDGLSETGISMRMIRRTSHFTQLSLLSAGEAIKDSGIDMEGKTIGIIQGSVYGPIISGIQAFDELIDFGDNQLSPTNFSGSVFNSSATYLSLVYGIQGPTSSFTASGDTLYNALLTASLWLENGTADYVIAGIGDEYADFFDDCRDGQKGLFPSSEGWTTFILSKSDQPGIATLNMERIDKVADNEQKKAVLSLWHEDHQRDDFDQFANNNKTLHPSVIRGAYPCGGAFDLALTVLLSESKVFIHNERGSKSLTLNTLEKEETVACYSAAEFKGAYKYEISSD